MLDPVRTLGACLMVVSSLASVGGNLLLLLVLLLHKDLRRDTLVLTVSVGLCDLALGLCFLPLAAHNAASPATRFPSDGAACRGAGFLFLLLQTSSLHSLAWATVDKFSQLRFALSYRRIWTGGRSRAALVLVWLTGLLCAAPPLLGFGNYAYSERRFLCCPSFTPENGPFVLAWALAGAVLPLGAVCALYGYMGSVARNQARRGTFVCNELHCFYVPANNYLRSSVAMVTTSVCVLACWLPYISSCLYETFSGQLSSALTSALSTWLVLTSAALNPWITCMMQTRYRAAARHTFITVLQKLLGTQSSAPNLHLTNRVSTTTTTTITTTTTTHPPSSVKTPPASSSVK